jgi:hypothetical protein
VVVVMGFFLGHSWVRIVVWHPRYVTSGFRLPGPGPPRSAVVVDRRATSA